MKMHWEDLDFSINEWRIPDTKNGESVRISLIEQTLEFLNNRLPVKALSMDIPWSWQEWVYGRAEDSMEKDFRAIRFEKLTYSRPSEDMWQLPSNSRNERSNNRKIIEPQIPPVYCDLYPVIQ
jgi:integrase